LTGSPLSDPRQERLKEDVSPDHRAPFERDRDRILYSSAFRRLEGITQVVGADHGTIFHNRLIHSIKVAQIGISLAQQLTARYGQLKGLVDPRVVECACLAHDLGHPPFGHTGEKELNRLLEKARDYDGFEGNAQSFRIVTKLAVRFEDHDGLNLTRGSLAAILKYPWLRERKNPDRSKKWGAYRIDQEAFDFATKNLQGRTVEAAIMDMADDLTYSVHDLEDFYRAGLIPDSATPATPWNFHRLSPEPYRSIGELGPTARAPYPLPSLTPPPPPPQSTPAWPPGPGSRCPRSPAGMRWR
jgi:dGTPase